MKIGSKEHRRWQEENGKKLRENLRKRLSVPVGDSVFDQIGYMFSRNLLDGLDSINKKSGARK